MDEYVGRHVRRHVDRHVREDSRVSLERCIACVTSSPVKHISVSSVHAGTSMLPCIRVKVTWRAVVPRRTLTCAVCGENGAAGARVPRVPLRKQ